MSKILDKIKEFGHSLADMLKDKKKDNVEPNSKVTQKLDKDYMNPDSKVAQELAERMKPYIDRINQLEEAQKLRINNTQGSYTQTLHVDSQPIKDTSKVVEGKGHSTMGKDAERDVQK